MLGQNHTINVRLPDNKVAIIEVEYPVVGVEENKNWVEYVAEEYHADYVLPVIRKHVQQHPWWRETIEEILMVHGGNHFTGSGQFITVDYYG